MKSTVLSVKYSQGSTHFSKHYHDCHELFYITDGRAKITVGSKEYNVKKGTLVIISRYEKHSVTVESSDYRRYTLRIAPDYYGKSGDDYTLYSVLTNRPESFIHAVDVSKENDDFEMLFSKIAREWNNKDSYSEKMADMYLEQILVKLFRLEEELFSHSDDKSLEIVRDIQNRFQRSCGQKYTLNQLSSEYNVSVFYLSHLFKKLTGYSVMNYLLSCRMANAKKLLSATDMDVSVIAHECGFGDSSNFSRKFREETGKTPGNFRKM